MVDRWSKLSSCVRIALSAVCTFICISIIVLSNSNSRFPCLSFISLQNHTYIQIYVKHPSTSLFPPVRAYASGAFFNLLSSYLLFIS